MTIVDLVRGKERVIQEGLAIDAAIRTAHWEMLREVFGEVQRLSRSEQEVCPRTISLAMAMRASNVGDFGHRRGRASLRRELNVAF